jgi:hypothetical protein
MINNHWGSKNTIGSESWCVMLGQWVCIMVSNDELIVVYDGVFTAPMVVNHGELC